MKTEVNPLYVTWTRKCFPSILNGVLESFSPICLPTVCSGGFNISGYRKAGRGWLSPYGFLRHMSVWAV